MTRSGKKERHRKLLHAIKANPFLTDEELAKRLGVSIQTIRLDRMELDIDELRERVKTVAASALSEEKFMQGEAEMGEILELEPGKKVLSLMVVSPEMTMPPAGCLRPYFLVAYAHAVAFQIFTDRRNISTTAAHVRFLGTAKEGESLLASAEMAEVRGSRFRIKVLIKVKQEKIFRATFHITKLEDNSFEAIEKV